MTARPADPVRMRTRRLARCERCLANLDACLCDLLVPIAVRTPIHILMHHTEVHKTTNTARLASLTMGARSDLWGEQDVAPPSLPSGPVLLLFPSDDARLLSAEDAALSPTLVVPDGNWAQARKIARRVEAGCAGRVTRVRVESGAPSGYVFRKTRREGALSTFEAIAHALAILEGADGPRVLEAARTLFDGFVARQSTSGRQLALART